MTIRGQGQPATPHSQYGVRISTHQHTRGQASAELHTALIEQALHAALRMHISMWWHRLEECQLFFKSAPIWWDGWRIWCVP